jgi:16S rRNA (cytosine1402-N4)-methyltransferase
MDFKHVSVLLEETIDGLDIKPDGIYVDGTLGGGGHAYEVCKRLSNKGRFIGIDQDGEALEAARKRLSEFEDKTSLVRSNYCEIDTILKDLNVEKVDGIVLDLGVSSYQIDNLERGFSYKSDAPLDMRMDTRQSRTASSVVNEYSEMELYRIIRDYGEDKFAKNIAKHIVKAREEKKIETTKELSDIIKGAIPMKVQSKGGHPAKKTFQAIRIEVNRELEVLSQSLDTMIDHLKPGGRMGIVLPDGDLSNQTLEYVRQWMIERMMIVGVISLPAHTFVPFGAGPKSSVLICVKPKDGKVPEDYPVFFGKLSKIGYDVSGKVQYKRNEKGELIDIDGNLIDEKDEISLQKRVIDTDIPELIESWNSFCENNKQYIW